MNTEDFIKAFVYEADGKIDSYHFIDKPPYKGDCDDHAVTVAALESGSRFRFWIDALTFKNSFHRVVTDWGEAHLVLHRRGKGYIDNIKNEWRPDIGFKRKFPFIRWVFTLAIKLAIGKVWGVRG
jgi:hypothetical protein